MLLHPLVFDALLEHPSHGLLTPCLVEDFRRIGSQWEDPDPLFLARYEDPASGFVYHASELDLGDGVFHGMVHLMSDDKVLDHLEWGYFSLADLCRREANFMPPCTRDRSFERTRWSCLEALLS